MNIIIHQSDLDQVLEKIDANGRFAMDLEFIPERTFHPILCLVQIATDAETFIIDPVKLPDLKELWQRVADPGIRKIFHAAVQDLDLIYKLSNLLPNNIFDTQIAAGFAGFGFPTGYGKLLQQVLGITIAKSESFTDWLERPLSASQIEYAKEDVCHLLPMADKLVDVLSGQGRLEWALEECRHYDELEQYVRASRQEFTRVKGANGLNRRALAVLQCLCEFREQEAERADRPARSILSDASLVELSRRPPGTVNDIYRIRGIRSDQVKSWGKRLIEKVEMALALPSDACPVWPSARTITKRESLIGDVLYAVLKVVAYQADIATELLATRDDIQHLVRLVKDKKLEEPDFSLLQGWRYEMAGKMLCELLQHNNLRLEFDLEGDPPIKLEFDKSKLRQTSER